VTTREKVIQAITQAESIADDPGAEPLVRTAAATLGMFRDQLLRWLPSDDDELDRLLQTGGAWMLSLRGDDS